MDAIGIETDKKNPKEIFWMIIMMYWTLDQNVKNILKKKVLILGIILKELKRFYIKRKQQLNSNSNRSLPLKL